MPLIDIGINLTHKRFQKDYHAVLERAWQASVDTLILTGVDVASSQASAQLCLEQHVCQLKSTAGVHPHDSAHVAEDWQAQLRALYALPQVCAVGECGLDYHRDFSPRAQQNMIFAQHIELALESQLPLFLHEREAHQDFYAHLAPHMSRLSGAVVHCFTGDLYSLKRYLDLGCYIGITGWVCDERRGQDLQQIVQYIPLDRILVETDAPFLTPRTLRPKPKKGRNEPAFLPHIVEQLAYYMRVEIDDLTQASYQNSRHLFQLG